MKRDHQQGIFKSMGRKDFYPVKISPELEALQSEVVHEIKMKELGES